MFKIEEKVPSKKFEFSHLSQVET